MTDKLSQEKCIPCKGGVPPLKGEKLQELYRQLDGGWQVVDDHHLQNEYRFRDFRHALEFTNKVGKLAEDEGHHPDIYLSWGKVILKVWTHKIGGLTKSDFVFAAKVTEL